jgi:Uma2 family endonuclease
VRVEGQVPPFVLEVVTKDSWERDTVEKPLLYDAMGVQEYVIFAPQRKDGGPLLFDYHRDAEGRFVPWDTDEQGALHSAVLGGLTLYVEEGEWLRLRDAQGQRLPSAEEEAERAEREAARAEQEAAARQAAEAELERLRALLGEQEGR